MNKINYIIFLGLFIQFGISSAHATKLVNKSMHGGSANDASIGRGFSNDGRYVAFESDASDIVSNDTNDFRDFFIYDQVTGTIERINVSSAGDQAVYEYKDGSVDFRSVQTGVIWHLYQRHKT